MSLSYITMLYILWRRAIAYYSDAGLPEPLLSNIVIVPAHFFREGDWEFHLIKEFMNTPECVCPCLMKLDLQKMPDKLAFLKDNWPTFDQIESINAFCKRDLQCTLCLLNALIDDLANEKCSCPNRDIIRLVMTRMYVQNALTLYDIKKEMECLNVDL